MTESAIQSILPSSDHTGSLSLTNPATNPSFIRSLYTQLPYNYHYFGLVVTLLMLVIYFIKAAVSVPQSDDQGELISHVFLLRCGGIIFSKVYMEYIDYCYGFLSPDLPWLNLITSSIAASPDLSPNSYLLFYANMAIPNTLPSYSLNSYPTCDCCPFSTAKGRVEGCGNFPLQLFLSGDDNSWQYEYSGRLLQQPQLLYI
jgi:hypothetical protein